MSDIKEMIAKRVAKELKKGYVVNLGIGLPTMVANFVPDDMGVVFQSENGIMDLGPSPKPEEVDEYVSNAGGIYATVLKGGVFFDSCLSFGIIRGGHVDATVLGALQVDSEGNLANWIIPGKLAPGMGGAMDLVCGTKKVIVAMTHTSKGKPKIFDKCTLPLTAANEVDMIITELGVFNIKDGKMELIEISPQITLEELKEVTPATYSISENLKKMEI